MLLAHSLDVRMEFIDQLDRTKARTLEYFDLSEEDLERSYAPGKWTIRYLLNHLADSETVLFYRIRRVISEPNQVIWFYAREIGRSTTPDSFWRMGG